jgi:hypothetical protein
LDDLLPDAILQALQYILIVLSSLALISAVIPWFALCLVPFFVLFWLISVTFLKNNKQKKREIED